jgi:predicted permease
MQTLWQDLRYGARMLMKQPGFTLIAVCTLALGIGANTAIFSLVNTVLLRSLPVANPQQIVAVNVTMNKGTEYVVTSYPNYKDLRDRNDVLAGIIAYRPAPLSLSSDGRNERVFGYLATGNYFDVLGVKAVLGRMFTQDDDRAPGAHPVTVMSYNLWQNRFGGDPNVVGKTVILNGHTFTVIGIAPKGFHGTEIMFAAAFWAPMMMQRQIEPGSNFLDERGDGRLMMSARLKDGVTKEQAQASLGNLMNQLATEYPDINEGRAIELHPPGLISPQFRTPIIGFATVLMGVVGLVLLIACTNLANLLLARATGRRKEIAIRLALGASRWQIMRQLLTESVLLALLGGAVGVLLAAWIGDLVSAFKPPVDFALLIDLSLDWRVLSFTLALSLLTGIVFGVLPALQSSRPDLVPALKDETAIAGYRRSWLRNGLVVAQVALSLVLLICAGLIVRSLQQAQSLNPGFNANNAVMVSFDLGLQGYDKARGQAFHQQALERVRALPGVEAAALADWLPLTLTESSTVVYVEGKTPPNFANLPSTIYTRVGPDYFRAMGISLLAGREFTPQEREEASRVVIVNETFARRFWPGENALGKQFKFGGADEPAWQIVGVAKDGKYVTLGERPRLLVYQPLSRNYSSLVNLVVRSSADAATALAAVRREVNSLDPTLPLYNVRTMREHLSLPLFGARVAATVLGAFGVLALLLAAIGIYGVMSYSVSQRTREVGIRMALGAQRSDVLKMMVRQGMSVALIGIGIGLAGAFGVTRLLADLLFGVSATDPLTFIVIVVLLTGVALLACFVPARRATKVDPIVALRCE